MLYVDAGAWALTDFLFRTRIVEEIKSEERDVEIEDGKTLTSVFLHWQMSASSAEVSSLIRQLGRMYFQIYFSFQTSSTRSFCIYLFFLHILYQGSWWEHSSLSCFQRLIKALLFLRREAEIFFPFYLAERVHVARPKLHPSGEA